MTLRQKQSIFLYLSLQLMERALELGYELTYGETYRSKEEAKRLADLDIGSLNSLHTVRLAIDLNLFKDGVYQRTTEAHRPLGEFWESLSNSAMGIKCCWGGRFGDGNHYSIEHEGRK